MNISVNPWTFVPTDVQTQTIASITLNADGTVTLVGSAALTAGMVAGAGITVIGVTNALYNGFYEIINLTAPTTAVLAPQVNSGIQGYIGRIPVGTAASAGGTVGLCQYTAETRVEDISWQSSGAPLAAPSSLAAADILVITDRGGNTIWSAVLPATSSWSQNRGKIFWVNGFTIFAMTHGIVLVTVN